MKTLSKSLALTGLVLLSTTGFTSVVTAQDASFVPQASVVLTCVDPNKTDKKITKFENNAPAGKKVVLVTGNSEGGGVSFGKEVKLGDTVTNTPQLFWSMEGVYLGPWEVPTTIEGTCLTNESIIPAYAEPKKSIAPYLLGAGAVVVMVGAFLLGRKLAKK